MDLGDSYGRVGGKIKIPEEDRNSIGRTTDSTNKDPCGHSGTEPQTRYNTQAGLRPLAH